MARPPRIDLAPHVGASAGTPPGEVSDFASKLASRNAPKRTSEEAAIPAPPPVDQTDAPEGYGLEALVAGPVDPELDLVSLNVRVPRYVADALDAQIRLRRGRKQTIVTDALKERVDPVLLGEAYRKATRT